MKAHRILCALSLLAAACGEDLSDVAPVLETYGALAEAEYEDALEAANTLDAALLALTSDPTEQALGDARDAWRSSREPYLQTEAYRYYGGPIEQGDPEHEGALNGWPIDESVIDYVVGRDGARLDTGIILDPSVAIDGASLRSLNEAGGEAALTTGYHPIEFLLWGQDDPDIEGPGARPVEDFQGGPAAERRAAYLATASDLLREDLAAVLAEWRDEPGTYRSEMVAGDPRAGLRNVLTGLAEMSGPELAGERILVAMVTRDQEDEHSCFSDNTHREIVLDAEGIQNVYVGRYERADGSIVEGASLSELVRSRDPDLDARMLRQLHTTEAAAAVIEGPFDRMILDPDDRALLDAVVVSLMAQTALIVEIAALFEIELNVE